MHREVWWILKQEMWLTRLISGPPEFPNCKTNESNTWVMVKSVAGNLHGEKEQTHQLKTKDIIANMLTSMVASVCMYSMFGLDRPSSLLPLCTELMIPDVIVFRRANGLPMATTNSPCRTSDDWPSVSVGKGFCISGEEKQKSKSSWTDPLLGFSFAALTWCRKAGVVSNSNTSTAQKIRILWKS